MRSRVASAIVAVLLVARAWASAPEPPERPAVLVEPGATVRAELRRAIGAALHGAPVALADDALTSTSELVIERVRPRDAAGRPLSGRDWSKPEHFRLVASGVRCILIHEQSGMRLILSGVRCRPLQ